MITEIQISDVLQEHMSFDQLFRISDPKRVARSFTVKGPPLDIDTTQDALFYVFNFKSSPSTTGLRHKGYVKFLKPRRQNPNQPLQDINCSVDCTCPDYRYRWAWSNKQRRASQVGPQSLNQALNRAPRITNPGNRPGLCKHILAMREYIYGMLSSFPGDAPISKKLDKLTRYATHRWANYDQLTQQARERDRVYQARRAARNVAGRLPEPEPLQPEELPMEPAAPPTPAEPAAPVRPPIPGEPPEEAPKPFGGYGSKAEYDFRRRQGLGDAVVRRLTNLVMERVVNGNGLMNKLTEAQKLVHEMADEMEEFSTDAFPTGEETDVEVDDTLEPMEPPIGDSAIGADTEGQTALGLLQSIATSLEKLVAEVVPEEEAAEEMEEIPEEPPTDEIPVDAPPTEGDEFEEEDEEAMPDARPSA